MKMWYLIIKIFILKSQRYFQVNILGERVRWEKKGGEFMHFNVSLCFEWVIIQIKIPVFISSWCNVETLLKPGVIFVNPVVECCEPHE